MTRGCNLIDSDYSRWIQENIPIVGEKGKTLYDVRGKCKEFAERMMKEFPELVLQAGFYHDAVWGKEQHWWLSDGEGNIIDPAASQFPTKGTGEYEHISEEERPIGKCANCGELCYPGAPSDSLCSEKCHITYVAYVNGEIGL